jgi:undecaprenyl-diphosphatase
VRRVVPPGLLLAIAALLAFAWLSREVLQGSTQAFDDWGRTLVHQWASPMLTWLMQWGTRLGGFDVLAPLTLVCTFGFLLAGRRRDALLGVVSVMGGLWLEGVLKPIVHRVRPEPFFHTPLPTDFSFPSGHALVASCFYGMVAALVAQGIQAPRLRWLIRALAALVIVLVGLSRVYLGVHYPSDVIGGYAAALVWVSTLIGLGRRRAGSASGP